MSRGFAALLGAIILAGCSTTSTTSTPSGTSDLTPRPSSQASASAEPTATPAGSLGRVATWRADIDGLVDRMAAIHPDLFHGTPESELRAAAAALSADVPNRSDDALMVGVLRLVAMVGAAGCDGHTGAFIWGTGTYRVESLPMRLWLFGDEVWVVDALPPVERLNGHRIVAINGHPIDEVLAALKPIIPRDNDQTVRLLAPRFLLIPQVLRGLGLAGDGPIALSLATDEGTPEVINIEPVSMSDYNAWAGPYGLHLPEDPAVVWLSDIEDTLWWRRLDDGETLFVQYNQVQPLGAGEIAQIRGLLDAGDISRVVLDLRHNFGGEVSNIDDTLDLVRGRSIDRADGLFVLIGRNTFSAGSMLAARLERDTEATFVGEATGGCPTLYGNARAFTLAASGIDVQVAGELSVGVDPADPRLTIEPDVDAVLTPEAWLAGRDPALETIVGVGP